MKKLADGVPGGGHYAYVAPEELAMYLARRRRMDGAPVANPLKHLAIGGLSGAASGALLAAMLTGKPKNSIGGAVLGGLAGSMVGGTAGAVKAIIDIVRRQRRKRELAEAFAIRHGLDPRRNLYANMG